MRSVVIVTDAWFPQVNGVVRTLSTTKAELEKEGYQVTVISPDGYRSVPCP
ncbi:MAG: glycosyltransferase family 1 protein, partial [Gammaproteobacteria bacterium]